MKFYNYNHHTLLQITILKTFIDINTGFTQGRKSLLKFAQALWNSLLLVYNMLEEKVMETRECGTHNTESPSNARQ